MLPEGWVTDIEPSRPKALKMLGNGVVPPQAAHAIRQLLGRHNARAVDMFDALRRGFLLDEAGYPLTVDVSMTGAFL